jgi:pimeloyl-ACP methyl ester carboxylesterase
LETPSWAEFNWMILNRLQIYNRIRICQIKSINIFSPLNYQNLMMSSSSQQPATEGVHVEDGNKDNGIPIPSPKMGGSEDTDGSDNHSGNAAHTTLPAQPSNKTTKQVKDCTILYLHGLESGPAGCKALYLQRRFSNVVVPDLRTNTWGIEANSIFSQAFWNIPSIFVGRYYSEICRGMLDGAAAIAEQAVKTHNPDIVVASSMGGATALELISRGVIKVPTLLLAPALKKVKLGGGDTTSVPHEASSAVMDPWYEAVGKHVVATATASAEVDVSKAAKVSNFPILVIHGDKDTTINLSDSVELCDRLNAELVTVAGGDHRLNEYLLDEGADGKDQLEPLIHRLWESKR